MSQQAVRIQAEDGAELTAAQLQQCVMEEEDLGLPPLASQVFNIWMTSSQLGESQRVREEVCFLFLASFRNVAGNMSIPENSLFIVDHSCISSHRCEIHKCV